MVKKYPLVTEDDAKKEREKLAKEYAEGLLIKKAFKIIELCKEGADGIKFINGDHFHIYLFLELEKMIKDLK